MEPKPIHYLQDRSEIAQEIISNEPGFLEKWSLFIFVIILFLMGGAACFIHSPDHISSRATLAAYNKPKEIIPMHSGRLIRLFVKNEQQVNKDELIGWIENASNPEEVLILSAALDSSLFFLANGKAEKMATLFQQHFFQLGSLQASYQTFIAALQQYNDYLVNHFYAIQKDMLAKDLYAINRMNVMLEKQKELIDTDNGLTYQSYEMNERLYEDKVISKEEYRTSQSRLVNKQMDLPRINGEIFSNQISMRAKIKELQQLEHDMQAQQTFFTQELETLKSSVDDWKLLYLIKAPTDGKIYFIMPVQQNQFIEEGKLLGYVSPPDTRCYAQLFLPQTNLHRVDTGMEVQLRFDGYPFREVGVVNGTLEYISRIAADSGFLASIRLDNGLITNLHYQIPYKSGLKAQAVVITRNMSLMEKLYYKTLADR